MAEVGVNRAMTKTGVDKDAQVVRVYENSGAMAHKEDAREGVREVCGAMGEDGRAVSEEGKDEEGKAMVEVEDGGAEVGNCKANVGVREES